VLIGELHPVQQLLGQGQNVVFGREHAISGQTTSNLLEVAELDFQGERSALEPALLDATY
jgi:hypothetical protein